MNLQCKRCPAPITRQSKSGYCRSCSNIVKSADPEFQAKRIAGIRRGLALNPERREAYRARVIEIGKLPHATEARRKKALELNLSAIGRAALVGDAAARERSGKRRTETLMAWCPPELREDYRRLVYSCKMSAAEAREIILAQHDKDMRDFRRKLAAAAA